MQITNNINFKLLNTKNEKKNLDVIKYYNSLPEEVRELLSIPSLIKARPFNLRKKLGQIQVTLTGNKTHTLI